MGDYGVNVIIVYGVPISIFLPHHQLYFYSALDITKLYCSNIVKLKKKKKPRTSIYMQQDRWNMLK